MHRSPTRRIQSWAGMRRSSLRAMNDLARYVTRSVAVATGLAIVVGLAACGSDSQPAATPLAASSTSSTGATSASTPPTPSPTPTEMTLEEAGAQYLQIVAASNKAVTALNKEVHRLPESGIVSKAAFKRLHPLSKRYADAMRSFSLALVANQWPKKVQKTVDKLAAEVATQQSSLRAIANAKTPTEWVAAWNAWQPKGDSAELLRQQLGLPERS